MLESDLSWYFCNATAHKKKKKKIQNEIILFLETIQ